jgi:hypothetical protein
LGENCTAIGVGLALGNAAVSDRYPGYPIPRSASAI